MAGHVSLSEVRNGSVTLMDLFKINAIMDSQDAMAEKMRRKNADR